MTAIITDKNGKIQAEKKYTHPNNNNITIRSYRLIEENNHAE